MNIVSRLLRKNLSPAQIAGFILSNFIGLAIVVAGIQLYQDVSSIWQDTDSFIKKDYIIVNKKVTAGNTLGESSRFTPSELADIRRQPWVREVGNFLTTDYHVAAAVNSGGHSLSTYMFFEAIPDRFIDVSPRDWRYNPGDTTIPIIISKDYLTLYNFGFASSAGLPQISEQLMSSVPMTIDINSNDGTRSGHFLGRVVGFSNRLNTILVPEEFMKWSNATYGSGRPAADPSRIIIDTNSPGDTAITDYLDEHGYESAGDKSASRASFLLNVVTGIIMAVGAVITVLSFFILLLSISLLMQKNRSKLHSLLQLGYGLDQTARPYYSIIIGSCSAAFVLALGATYLFRAFYIAKVTAVGGGGGNLWAAPVAGGVLTLLIVLFNIISVRRKVASAWRL